MNNIFSMDNPFFRFMGRVTDLIWLNILTLICCFPLFTAGAAISSMYHVLIKITLNEEGVVTKPFFREFKANFKNATIVWIPSMVVFIVMLMNAYLIYKGVLSGYPNLLLGAGISIGIIVAVLIMFLTYYFSLISRYENSVNIYIKNALFMMVAYFPRSICMLMIWIFPLAIMRFSPAFLLLWPLYGLSLPGYVSSMLLGRLFVKTEKNGAEEEEDIGNTDEDKTYSGE